MTGTTGLLVVGRPTFDLDGAEPIAAEIVAGLRERSHCQNSPVVGDATILTTAEEVSSTIRRWPSLSRLVVVFASFSDASLAEAATRSLTSKTPTVLWSIPEIWDGGRLRWNSLCGANLAAYSLVADGRVIANVHSRADDEAFSWALDWLAAPRSDAAWPGRCFDGAQQSSSASGEVEVASASSLTRSAGRDHSAERAGGRDHSAERAGGRDRVAAAAAKLRSLRLGVVGEPPIGFGPCEIPAGGLPFGACTDAVTPQEWFAVAERRLEQPEEGHRPDRSLAGLVGSSSIGAVGIGRSEALEEGLRELADGRGWDAVAVKCWPECFDSWGGAACAAMSELNDDGVPAACECDALGSLTMVAVTELCRSPVFLADFVDVDLERNQIALWHCGVAPRSFADRSQPVRITTHPNRGVPAVFDFGLAPGRVTLARLSQAKGTLRMVIGTGTVVERERPFVGTSGVVVPDRPVASVLHTVFAEGLEHHVVVGRGDVSCELAALARELGIDVVALT